MPSFWDKIRSDFPITKNFIYLDHASGGPIPWPVHEKIIQFQEEHLREADLAWPRWIKRREDVREKVARFINADPSEITFTSSTSQGMNDIAELLAGEGSVLINSDEFPSSTLPWIWRKAKMIWQKSEAGKISLKTLQEKLETQPSPCPLPKRERGSVGFLPKNERENMEFLSKRGKGKLRFPLAPAGGEGRGEGIKTIVSSFVQYATGFRQDIESLGKIKQDRYLVVNATQGFGAFQIDVRKWNADFLCTNSYKWLMGGYGGGILYIKKKWLERFQPQSIGWRSMCNPEAMDNQRLDMKPEASRYEWGCPSFPTIFAVGAAVDYLSQIGIQKIQQRILELTDYLIGGLERLGLEVVSPQEPEHRSGIVVFRTKEAEKIRRKLLAAKIFVSARGEGIRIAPHFYNSLEEIEILLKKLKANV